ncbi:MAG: hypothetical protein AAF509_17485 [Pseudomonadota bacterium]
MSRLAEKPLPFAGAGRSFLFRGRTQRVCRSLAEHRNNVRAISPAAQTDSVDGGQWMS